MAGIVIEAVRWKREREAFSLLTGEGSICSPNSLPSELPLLHGSGAGTLKGPASVRYLKVPMVGTVCVPSSSEDFLS